MQNIEAIKERESKVQAEPIRKITKKGEEEIEQSFESTPVEGDLPKQLPVLEAQTPGDTTAEHGKHLFDANCDICQGKVVRAPEVQERVTGAEEGREEAAEPQRWGVGTCGCVSVSMHLCSLGFYNVSFVMHCSYCTAGQFCRQKNGAVWFEIKDFVVNVFQFCL